MDQSFHTLVSQVLAQFVAVLRSNDVILITVEVLVARKMWQTKTFNRFQPFTIQVGDLPAMFDPGRKMTQLNVENRGLDIVKQSRVAMVVEFTGLPVLAIKSHESCKS